MGTSKSKMKRLEEQMTVEEFARWIAKNVNPITVKRAAQILRLEEKTKQLRKELGYED